VSGASDLGPELAGQGLRVAILAARFNDDIVGRLVEGARDELARHACAVADTVWVPGAFEIPVVAARLASSGHDAVVALGCIIRGGTPHFDYVCTAVTIGCEAVARESGRPVGFGVLTVDDHASALARAGGDQGNKGAEAAQAAVEAALVLRSL